MDSDYLQERQVFCRRVTACYGEEARLHFVSRAGEACLPLVGA